MEHRSSAIQYYFDSFQPKINAPTVAMLAFEFMLKVNLWIDTARSRRQLGNLSDDQLRDIGICRADAEAEARRRFYDL